MTVYRDYKKNLKHYYKYQIRESGQKLKNKCYQMAADTYIEYPTHVKHSHLSSTEWRIEYFIYVV